MFRIEEHTAQITPRKAQEFQEDFRKGNIQILSCSTTFELGVDLGDLDIVFLRNVPPESFNYAQRVGRAGRRSVRIGGPELAGDRASGYTAEGS
ncbi:MAG: helicase C-terminal domain-containing protein [Anaerolineae bacterium]|nr:helicase C-terminal domain-containing protein [Anaerolineae bacterium]